MGSVASSTEPGLRRRRRLTALVTSASMVVASLATVFTMSGTASAAPSKSVTVDTLYYTSGASGPSGGTSAVTIGLANGGKEFRVGFSEDEVAGTGDQWRAAGWNAATVATLLTGSPLSGVRVNFDLSGRTDGPSAGAALTVGILSMLRGDKLKKNVIMTGTINPDGTIGPVGGIPYKLDGAAKAKKTVMLVPEGQRNSPDDSGTLVDLVDAGDAKGIEVKEVSTIFDAYKEFTGKTLPSLAPSRDVGLSKKAYTGLQALTEKNIAQVQSLAGEFNALDPTIQSAVSSFADLANTAASKSQNLLDEGIEAGAYSHSLQAVAFATGAVKVGRALQVYFTQGTDAFVSQIESSAAVSGKAKALFTSLKGYQPANLSEAAGLMDSYGTAIDALLISDAADSYFSAANDATTQEEVLSRLIMGAVFDEIAGVYVDGAESVQHVTSGLPGPKVSGAATANTTADFLRKAAQANLEAFDTVVVAPAAESEGVSTDQVKQYLATKDFDYLLATEGSNTLGAALDQYLKTAKNSDYANLGAALNVYSRSASLLAKYYSLGAITDSNGDVTDVQHQAALIAALKNGNDQASGALSLLKAKQTESVLLSGAYEVAGVDREGSVSDKLDALASYFGVYLGGRVLAYLGGFPTAGLK